MAEIIRVHALCSPSSADRWLNCPGSIAMEDGEADSTSDAASDGTQDHDAGAHWLIHGEPPPDMTDDPERVAIIKGWVDHINGKVEAYQLAGARTQLFVEVRVPLQEITGEKHAGGTADAIIIAEDPDGAELDVDDLKTGYRAVPAETPQLAIYALGALEKYGLIYDFTKVRCTIFQPRAYAEPQSCEYTTAELATFGEKVRNAGELALQILEDGKATALQYLNPTEKGCLWCKAKAKCPALSGQVHETVFGEFSDIEDPKAQPVAEDNFTGSQADFDNLLPLFMQRVPMIEAWISYVRAKVEQRLVSGVPVPGFKLVIGRAGARKWRDEDVVRKALLANNVPKSEWLTAPELLTPAKLEKGLKKTYPTAWDAASQFITQEVGKPSVAPESDPRPPFAAASFDGQSYDAADLV